MTSYVAFAAPLGKPGLLLPDWLSPATLRRSLSFVQRLVLWQLCTLLSGCLVYACRGRCAPGRARLWVASAVVTLNALVPLLFDGQDDIITHLSSYIATTAVGSFKVLAWASNRGALVQPLSLPQFLAVFSLPITPAQGVHALGHFYSLHELNNCE